MMDTTTTPVRWRNSHQHFLTHLLVMPLWHKAVILLAGLAALLGTAGQLATSPVVEQHVAKVTGNDVAPPPPNARGFVNDAPGGNPTVPVAQPADSPRSFTMAVSPHAKRVGLSIVLGFVIGWFFRAFVKTMAFLLVLVAGGLWLLSHFNILHLSDANIDQMKDKSATAVGWLTAQASHLKDLAVAHLPSTGGGAFGAFLGVRRR
jgi:uncharacterized membrane protein (Fun14 family)